MVKARTVGQVVAERVRHYRSERGWTQEQLADEMGQLGYPINRATLAKLENGGTRAANVPLAEVLALAAALDVPPVLLFVPLGSNEDVAVVPKARLHPFYVFRWVIGEVPFAIRRQGENRARRPDRWKQNRRPVRQFHEATRLADRLRLGSAYLEAAIAEDEPADQVEAATVRLDGILKELDRCLRDIEADGLEAPWPLVEDYRLRLAELLATEED